MFGDGSNDGNVLGGIFGIPQRVETSSPRGNDTGQSQSNQGTKAQNSDTDNKGTQQSLKLLT